MKKILCGNGMDKMPDFAFHMMSFMFWIMDQFHSPSHRLDSFGIQPGYVVVDCGSGTGRYLKQASELAGPQGTVYAVDIQPLAIESVNKVIRKQGLLNVRPLLTEGKYVNIPCETVDLIYALDMFHMVSDTFGFLSELHRILKPEGILILEDGHQSRNKTRSKVLDSRLWTITEETKHHLRCKPLES
jgi:ubiquinone/menaquinone biosynthesis C-methylase UbiE